MKRNKNTLLVLSSLSLAAFGLAGCDSEPSLSIPSEVVEKYLNVTTSNTTIALANVSSFDAKTLFKITDDGKEVAMQVKVGDKVIYSKYSGTEVELDDEKYVVVKQNDILAVIE